MTGDFDGPSPEEAAEMAERLTIARAAGPAREGLLPENNPDAAVRGAFARPEYGDPSATRGGDGKAWSRGRNHIDGRAGAVLEGLGSSLGVSSEDDARRVFGVVPDRFKAVERFHASEGFQEPPGVDPEGRSHDRDERGSGPESRLVKQGRSSTTTTAASETDCSIIADRRQTDAPTSLGGVLDQDLDRPASGRGRRLQVGRPTAWTARQRPSPAGSRPRRKRRRGRSLGGAPEGRRRAGVPR